VQTQDETVLGRLDRSQTARKRGKTRSRVVEQTVCRWARRSAAKDIEDATIAYYQAMTPSEYKEDEAWSRLGETTLRSEQG
jgi:hypothetical protein